MSRHRNNIIVFKKPFELELEDTETDSGGDSSDSGSSGFNEPIIDMAIFGFTKKAIRNGARQFAITPLDDFSQDSSNELGMGEGLEAHPLLNETQRLDGQSDAKNSANPRTNEKAAKEQQLRLEKKLQNSKQLTNRNSPRPSPT